MRQLKLSDRIVVLEDITKYVRKYMIGDIIYIYESGEAYEIKCWSHLGNPGTYILATVMRNQIQYFHTKPV